MTVSALIERLKEVDGELEVFVLMHSDLFVEVTSVEINQMKVSKVGSYWEIEEAAVVAMPGVTIL
jgi:hypothetical protein